MLRKTGILKFIQRLCLVVLLCSTLSGCDRFSDEERILTQNTQIIMMDWHICGLWIINSPVAWVRVYNYNLVPIKDITFQYNTYTDDGQPLNEGTFTIEGAVQPQTSRNFIELYLGLVDLPSQRLSIKLLSVKRAHPEESGRHL